MHTRNVQISQKSEKGLLTLCYELGREISTLNFAVALAFATRSDYPILSKFVMEIKFLGLGLPVQYAAL